MKAGASKRELEMMDCGLQAKYREGDDHGRGPREQRGPAEIQQGQSGGKHTSKLEREELVPKICLNRFQDGAVAGDEVATEECVRGQWRRRFLEMRMPGAGKMPSGSGISQDEGRNWGGARAFSQG